MAERRTSAAKDYITRDDKAILETYGVARNHFEHARDPLISQQHKDLAREQAEVAAREKRGSILERGDALLPEFNKGGDSVDREGSQMVKNDQPRLQPRPPEEIAKPVDREHFDKKWYEELNRAREQENDRDKDHENDREPSR